MVADLNPLLVGFHGYKYAGKNTAAGGAQMLAVDFTVNYKEWGFAHYLKWYAYQIFKPGCSLEESLYWADTIKKDVEIKLWKPKTRRVQSTITGRQLMQHMGNQAREVFGEDFWVDLVIPVPDRYQRGTVPQWWVHGKPLAGADVAAVTDVRYPNEIERIQELGGKVIAIKRQGMESDGTPSEQDYSELCDQVIRNDEGPHELRNAVRNYLYEVSSARLTPR